MGGGILWIRGEGLGGGMLWKREGGIIWKREGGNNIKESRRGGGMTALHMNWKNSKTKANGPIEREGERCILKASS